MQRVGGVLRREQVVPARALQLHAHGVVLAVARLQGHTGVYQVQQWRRVVAGIDTAIQSAVNRTSTGDAGVAVGLVDQQRLPGSAVFQLQSHKHQRSVPRYEQM
jgi:hypothetical protein